MNAKLMLNSLYGKFGMKDIVNKMKIINKSDHDKFIKTYNYTILTELDNDKLLVKYSGKINEKLRLLYKAGSSPNPINGLFKSRGNPSSVHIAAAIAGYSRVLINKYKNIPNNPLTYTDTDSIVLPKPLDSKYISTNLGDMKLEYSFIRGIFIRKKYYGLLLKDNTEIIKSSGGCRNYLKFTDLEKSLNNDNIVIYRQIFKLN